jgi:hypothetical protein
MLGRGPIHGVPFVDCLRHIAEIVLPLNTTGQTTLYTVPAGKIFIPHKLFIRAGASAGNSVITVGRVGALTDWLSSRTLSHLDTAGDVVKIEVINSATPAKSKTYAAGVVLQIDVTTADGGATNYADLFGYLVNA